MSVPVLVGPLAVGAVGVGAGWAALAVASGLAPGGGERAAETVVLFLLGLGCVVFAARCCVLLRGAGLQVPCGRFVPWTDVVGVSLRHPLEGIGRGRSAVPVLVLGRGRGIEETELDGLVARLGSTRLRRQAGLLAARAGLVLVDETGRADGGDAEAPRPRRGL